MEMNITNGSQGRYYDPVPRVLYKEIPIVFNLVGVVLNAILIIYFIKSKKYKSPIFTILTSLACMDFITCLAGAGYAGLLFPFMTTRATHALFTCKLLNFLSNLGTFASEYDLLFFAALRLYQMASPLKARARVTTGLMIKLCFLIVFVVSIFMLAYALLFVVVEDVYQGETVMICRFGGDRAKKDMGLLVFGTVLPCSGILVLHFSKHCVVSASRISTDAQQERKNTDARAVTIVIILFFIAWIPAFSYKVIQQLRGRENSNRFDNLFLVLLYVLFSNSLMNPLVYCVAVKSVRDDILRVFRCKKVQ